MSVCLPACLPHPLAPLHVSICMPVRCCCGRSSYVWLLHSILDTTTNLQLPMHVPSPFSLPCPFPLPLIVHQRVPLLYFGYARPLRFKGVEGAWDCCWLTLVRCKRLHHLCSSSGRQCGCNCAVHQQPNHILGALRHSMVW